MLKRAKIDINVDKDEAIIFGKKLTLEKLLIGHYVLPLRLNYRKVEPDVCVKGAQMKEHEKSKRMSHH